MFEKEKWPKGTEIKKTPEGKTEIKFREPMSGKKLMKETEPRRKKNKLVENMPSQKSANIGKKTMERTHKGQKINPNRESVRQEIREGRKFKESVKWDEDRIDINVPNEPNLKTYKKKNKPES